jgi:RHS repeat-associated protein
MSSGKKWRQLAYALVLVVVVGTLAGTAPTPAAAAVDGVGLSGQREPRVAGHFAKGGKVSPEPTGKPWRAQAPMWPEPGLAEVALAPVGARAAGAVASTRAGDLPVWLDQIEDGAESLRRVRVRQLGHDRVVLRISRADGVGAPAPARVTVDAGRFRSPYGGDWLGRLKLWQVSEGCLTAAAADCRATPLPSRVDQGAATVTAAVDIAGSADGTLIVLEADQASANGDWKATSLSPSAAWSAGGNTGGFSWNYPLRVPPSLGGPTPSIALSYSSASVDGRMASGNNQPSWLGEGFDWHPGYIERRYIGCADDMAADEAGVKPNNPVKTGDLCWKTDNAILSMPGRAGELMRESSADRWHLRDDDGTRVERKAGAGNTARGGEWWVVTTTDGTQYWFGGRADSNATLTVPVFGNHANEPCHEGTFAASSCAQAYRWQLDHVVDVHGNTMRLNYVKETNRYGRNLTPSDAVPYDRAGYLTSIAYGTRSESTERAPMLVEFASGDRCVAANCADKANWPDVPQDLECTGSPCGVTQMSPSFWTKKRLTSVTTKVWDAGRSDYDDVDRWNFTHSFPDPSDSVGPVLWLHTIVHSGRAGSGSIDLPDVTFSGVYLPNRVDTNNDQYPAMNRFRINTVTSETGAVTNVDYAGQPGKAPHPQRCAVGGPIPDGNALHENGLLCYPVKWTPPGHDAPINDFFHKYVVTDIHEAEATGSSPLVATHYDYEGAPAWHYTDEDGLTKPEFKTWSVWRGYSSVVTTVGAPGEQTKTRTRYLRGMHGDKQPSGTRTVKVAAVVVDDQTIVPEVEDENEYAGMVRERITYSGTAEVSATAVVPWRSPATASRTLEGVTVHARYTGEGERHTRTTLDGGRDPRLTKVLTTFDSYGMPVKVEDHGDTAVAEDQSCALTDYNRNVDTWMVDRVSRQRTFAVDCTKAEDGSLTDAEVIGDVRTSYDQAPEWETAPAPTRGLVSKVETLKTFDNDQSKWTYVTEKKATHDLYGRVVESWDVRGAKTTHAYTHTPSAGGPVTGKTVTNQLGWVTTTAVAPAWGLPTRSVDQNGGVTELKYDALGRLTSVWLPGRDRGTSTQENNASIRYDYVVRNNDQGSVVTTHRLVAPDPKQAGDRYVTSQTIFDGMLRARQTQSRDGAGSTNAVVTDTFYDSAGRVNRVFNPYVADKPMSNILFKPTNTTIPSAKTTTYDGAGRVSTETAWRGVAPQSPGGGELIHQTRYRYGGDRVDTTPPTGGIVTSAINDAAGRVVENRQYEPGKAAGDSDGFDRTTYTYNAKDQLERVTDPSGATWSYEYDLRGRVSKTTDPDLGVTTSTYFDSGDLATQTDNQKQTLAYTYDILGRKTTLRDDSATGDKRAEWTYDTSGTLAKGQLSKSIRYVTSTQKYEKNILGYDTGYRPTRVEYIVPSTENMGATTFTYDFTFHPEDGSPETTRIPTAGGLSAETLTHQYDSLGRPSNLKTSLGDTYVTGVGLTTDPATDPPGTQYTSFSELATLRLRHNSGRFVHINREYFEDTRRLKQIWTSHQELTDAGAPKRVVNPDGTVQQVVVNVSDVYYGYDLAGNVTSINDTTSSDYQCFRLDHQQRLTDAWTPAAANACGTAPDSAALGGPAKYRHSYAYDKGDNRTTMTQYGTPTGDRTTTYAIGAGGHHITGTRTVDNTGTHTASYGHDDSGNVTARPTGAGSQILRWDKERRLATTTDTTGETSYIYDADGNRLIRHDPAGTTLYLPGQEVRVSSSGSRTATRYYTHAGQTIATRTRGGVTWLAGDHHGTTHATINASGPATVTTRRQTPFGEPRGATGSWPATMDKGFVGGTKDPTGLTHLGAREYDPALGRFLSVDPLIDMANPQQINGYHYGNHNPVTLSDPDGLIPKSCPDGECYGGPYGNSPGPATTYNPPVDHAPSNGGHQPKNNNRANCPDGGRGCPIAPGSTQKRPLSVKQFFGKKYHADKTEKTHELYETCASLMVPYLSAACAADNALVYAEEGDWENALLSAVDLIPFGKGRKNSARGKTDVDATASKKLPVIKPKSTPATRANTVTGSVRRDVYGDTVVNGGSVEGDVYGLVILLNGGKLKGNVYGGAVMLGGTIVGNVYGPVFQGGSLSGGISIGGRRIFESYIPPSGIGVTNEILPPR